MNKEKIIGILPYSYVCKRTNKRIITSTTGVEPDLYNKYGEKKRTFYLRDAVCSHSPYTFSSQNTAQTRYINWDRYNIALPVHFYSHRYIMEDTYQCEKKFAFLFESEELLHKLYNRILSSPERMSGFTGIFTHSERLLEKYPNAHFIPGSSVWYGGTCGGGVMSETLYQNKTKNISLVSSDKAACDLHKYRLQLAQWLYHSNTVDVMGTFNGGSFVSISESLQNYRYSIAIENNITSCYFTEKLLNCFAAMTVPIYIGATDIGRWFNTDGIIQINPFEERSTVEKVLSQCNENDYMSRKDAIIDNFNRVKKYMCIEDYIYENYGNLF